MTGAVSPAPVSGAMKKRLSGAARARRWLDPISRLSHGGRRAAGSPRRIGVLLQWGIGDAVIVLPLLHALHDTWPEAVIEPIGKPFLADLLAGEPAIGECHLLVPPWTRFSRKYRLWDREWRGFLRDIFRLRRRKFDLLVAPRFDPRDAVQARLIRAHATAGFGAAGGRHWLTYDGDRTAVEGLTGHYGKSAARLAEVIVGRPVDPAPRFRRIPQGADAMRRFRAAGYAGGPILAVTFGASHPTRYWDPAKIEAVLKGLGDDAAFMVIVEDPGREAPRIALAPGMRGMIWQSGLHDLADMLSAVTGVFCTDSGPMHVAAAAGRPVVAIFGPSEPGMFGPLGSHHQILAAPEMPCRPCFDACLYDRPICLDGIAVDEVTVAIRRMLASS